MPTASRCVKIMKTTWNDFGKESCDCRYFAGLLGKVSWIGGLAFDDAGISTSVIAMTSPRKTAPSWALATTWATTGAW